MNPIQRMLIVATLIYICILLTYIHLDIRALRRREGQP